ncbi:hypothetical protein K1X76_12615 [bacterium]|nr:hypothetical protein [bacterium]
MVTKKKETALRIKTSPRLEWVLPYIRKAKAKMPGLVLPTQIRSFKPTKKRIMRVYANVYFETRIIVLATHTQQTVKTPRGKTKIKKIFPIPRTEILDTLAHELAHLKYPDHNYEHEEYTRTIFRTFGMTQKCPTCQGTGKLALESRP